MYSKFLFSWTIIAIFKQWLLVFFLDTNNWVQIKILVSHLAELDYDNNAEIMGLPVD